MGNTGLQLDQKGPDHPEVRITEEPLYTRNFDRKFWEEDTSCFTSV